MTTDSADAVSDRPRLRGSRRIAAWAAVAAAGALILLVIVLRLRPPEVPTLTVEAHDVRRTLVVAGRLQPPSRSALGPAVAGVVREVLVRDGDRVQRGQVLVVLDDEAARADVREAESLLAQTSADVRSRIEQAALELEQAERDLARLESVLAVGGVSRQRVDQAAQRAADARSRLDALRSEGADNAEVLRARAALEGARARLDRMRITAPSDGTVLARRVEPGDAAQPGAVLLEMAADGPVEVVAYPSEESLGSLVLGASAVISADAYPQETFAATLTEISPAVDPAQGTVEVTLSVDQPPDYLRADMTVSANIEAGQKSGVPVLPATAVGGLGTDASWVAVVQEGRVVRRPVSVGLRGDSLVEVAQGLEIGDRVLTAPQAVEPGDRVRPGPPR